MAVVGRYGAKGKADGTWRIKQGASGMQPGVLNPFPTERLTLPDVAFSYVNDKLIIVIQ